jgi:hypothetical protein
MSTIQLQCVRVTVQMTTFVSPRRTPRTHTNIVHATTYHEVNTCERQGACGQPLALSSLLPFVINECNNKNTDTPTL